MIEIPAAPDFRTLRETALAHLARFATTEQGLRQMLERRLRRWGMRAVQAGLNEEELTEKLTSLRGIIDDVVYAMRALGAVDDPGFARTKASSLARTGRSRRAVEARLQQKGIDAETAQEALSDSLGEKGEAAAKDAELAAALILARKRRVGPFRRDDRPQEEHMRVLGIFARNGFSRDVSETALSMDRYDAEERIIAFRNRH
ncbi:regulatory protein RecX [Neokomagataea anthophila]|uniref:Regulatory protein RecX n=1 Tax=Neokomagataea anthophila TaxID=2826925 RepID=A0ABS5E8Q5_9PROT|nr:RecX family transcriptional regulator [Neokomagataea anthophila]MBR0560289.1 RecX family transcriptional regulator [Neokomagataea anthophila]